jgi:hypothetical protein
MKRNGFAILYTVLIITIAVTLSMNVSSLITKERALSRVARNSIDARAAADVGMECMLYKDKMPTEFDVTRNPIFFMFNCGRDSAGNPVNYNATLTTSTTSAFEYSISTVSSVTGPCFKAYLNRDLTTVPASTKVQVYGYNICDITNPNRVERGVEANYSSFFSGGGGSSGFSLIANGASTIGSGSATRSNTASLNTTGANLIVVGITWYGTYGAPFTPPPITDSYGNTWTPLTAQLAGSGQAASQLYYAISPTVGSGHVFTVGTPMPPSTYPTIYVEAFSSSGTPTFDQQTGASAVTASQVNTGALTPGGNNALIVVLGNFDGGTVTNFNSGITITDSVSYVPSVNFGGAMGYTTQSTPSSINPLMTNNGTWIDISAVMATFLP